MVFSSNNIIVFLFTSILLSACGGGITDAGNNHPSQFAPKTTPDLTIKRNEKNQLIVDWPEQQNSQEYILYISSSENFEKNETTTIKTNKAPYIITDLETGKNYHVKLKSSWETKVGPESNKVEFIAPPLPPSNISIEEASLITWANESDSFNIYWSTNQKFSISDAEGSATGITEKKYQPHKNAYQDDEIIYYIVTATNNDIESAISEKIQIAALDLIEAAITPPNNPKVTVSNGSFNMEWPLVNSANNYNVYMAQDSGVTKNNATSLTGGMTHLEEQSPFGHGLANGSRYYLVVTATNSKNEESTESTELSIKPKTFIAGVPSDLSIQADKDHVTLNWTAVDNAQSYNVYWSNSPDVTTQSGKLVPGGGDITNTTITHTGIQNGLMHYYVVTTITNEGESEESAEVGAVPFGILPEPSDIQAKAADKKITLTWPEIPGAVKYHLYMAQDESLTTDNAESLAGSMIHKDNITSPFTHPGLINDTTYYFRLTAIDQFGNEGNESALIQATPHAGNIDPTTNNAPTVAFSIEDLSSNEDSDFNFQFAENTFEDPENDTLIYTATLSNSESLPNWLKFNSTTRTFSGTPKNDDVGSIEIKLNANDGNNNSVSDTFNLEVINTNDTPIAKNIPPQSTFVGTNFTYSIDKNTFTDEDVADILTISVSSLPDWLSFDSSSQTFTGTSSLADIGSTEIIITATDDNNKSGSTNLQLTVVTSTIKPTATNDKPEAILEGGSTTIDILANDIAATNSNLDPLSVKIISDVTNGETAINTDGSIFYQHNGKETIMDSFTYQVKDNLTNISNIATVDITITPINDAPVATDDNSNIILAPGSSITIDITDNDSDEENALDPSSIVIKTQGSKGTATVDINGIVTYQSKPGVIADDSFTYTIKDLSGLESNIATVTIVEQPWQQMDIGDVGNLTGSSTVNSDFITVNASGADIWNNADAFHFLYKEFSGDIDFQVQVNDLQNTQKWTKAGIMIRESNIPESKHANVYTTDFSKLEEIDRGIHLNARLNDGELTYDLSSRLNSNLSGTPRFIRLIRRGDTFNSFESSDGNNWLLIGTTKIPMTQNVLAGLVVTSHSIDALSSATFNNISIKNQTIAPPVMIDIAANIDSTNKTFNLTNQTINSESLYYHITGLKAGNTYTVDINSPNGRDINLQVFHDEFNTLECQSFLIDLAYDACLATANASGEIYVHLDGSYATDANFNLKLTEWTAQDINTLTSGNFSETDRIEPLNDEYLIGGSGQDIASTADGFRFFYQPISGDVEIIARVTSQENTHGWAKAGIMIRESIDVADGTSRFVDVVLTPENSVRFQARKETAVRFDHFNTKVNNIVKNRWLRLLRRGTAFDAFESGGKKGLWQFLGTVDAPNIPTNTYVGLAVSAHNRGLNDTDDIIGNATFENIKVYNGRGPARTVETITGSATPISRSVDITDKFFKITGLDKTVTYKVELTDLSHNADLYVYAENSFTTLLCPSSGATPPISDNPDPTTSSGIFKGVISEYCTSIQPNGGGEIYVRVNGSYTSNGANFKLTISQE